MNPPAMSLSLSLWITTMRTQWTKLGKSWQCRSVCILWYENLTFYYVLNFHLNKHPTNCSQLFTGTLLNWALSALTLLVLKITCFYQTDRVEQEMEKTCMIDFVHHLLSISILVLLGVTSVHIFNFHLYYALLLFIFGFQCNENGIHNLTAFI